MNPPTKAVEATSTAQNADKTSDNNKSADNQATKTDEKKPEVTNPAPQSVK